MLEHFYLERYIWVFLYSALEFHSVWPSAHSSWVNHCATLRLICSAEDLWAAELITEVMGCRLGRQIYSRKVGRHICKLSFMRNHMKPNLMFNIPRIFYSTNKWIVNFSNWSPNEMTRHPIVPLYMKTIKKIWMTLAAEYEEGCCVLYIWITVCDQPHSIMQNICFA